MNSRLGFPLLMLAGGLAAVAWAVLRAQLPPADFTFVNETEIKTVDPHNVTGIPEHRIVESLFEGLTRLDPQTCQPLPGVAESWDTSDDKTVYTFHVREDARWSNGEPVTAEDFVFSYRRFLDPQSAAEYAYLAWYIKNARRYTIGASGIGPGDPVEVEMNQRSVGSLAFARGEVLYGKLIRIDGDRAERVFVVNVDGHERRFQVGEGSRDGAGGIEPCKQVLLDFREVGVRAIDNRTLEIKLDHPTPYWLSLIAYHAVLPVNRTCVETYGLPQWTFPENIVTNGPYRIEFRRIRDRIRLVKNDEYWDRANVRLEVIDALAITSQVTMFNLFETGKADWIADPPAIVLRELLKPGRERKYLNPKPFLCTYYYMCNTNRKPLGDVRVRRALALALDREEITRTAVAAGEVAAYSLVPPGMPDYESPTLGEENVAEARRLLAEAGYPDGRGFPKLDILYNTHEAHQTIAQLVRKQWQRNLGINVSTRNEEWASYQSEIRQQEYNIARRGWVGDYIDPSTYLDIMVTGCENNNTGWSNAEYDRLILSARTELDEARRIELFRRAERIVMDELPIIPIYYYVCKSMVKPYVRGFYGNLLDNHPLRAIWIDHDLKGPNEFMRD
jgi:oligopeptide transport system substrate-binding protein